MDRTVMLSGATLAHRCYAQFQPFAPDLNHQENSCLSAKHQQCPFYTTPVQPEQTVMVPALVQQPPMGPMMAVPTIRKASLPHWLPRLTMVSIGFALLLAILTLVPDLLRLNASSPATSSGDKPVLTIVENAPPAGNQQAVEPSPIAVISTTSEISTIVTQSLAITAVAILLPTITPTPMAETIEGDNPFVTPTPEPGGAVFYLAPGAGEGGWWSSGSKRRNYLNDSFLYAGFSQDETYISSVRFDLGEVPRGASIRLAQVRLTGLRQDRFMPDVKAVWLVELLAENAITSFGAADFLTMYSASSSITLQPLESSELAQGKVNVLDLDPPAVQWLEQQLLDGAKTLIIRIKASTDNGETLFAWDSGLGPLTAGTAPRLLLSLGPPPPTPPPLPTKPFIVATPTPIPANVLTVVAQGETATAVALTTGTYTPVPFDYYTPTPYPQNLETVQAVAIAKGLPPVLIETPTPANDAIATGNAMYATAVAQTTGTFTPVPTEFATPILVLPSPPALNQGTEVARILEATAVAESGAATSTPLPYNAVIAQYVVATPTAANVATVAAMQLIESVYGTPTPLPWGMIVITPVPPPISPTATPLPPLLSVNDFTPTPSPLAPTIVPDVLPDFMRGKILFTTTRYGQVETYAFDPVGGQLYKVTEPWIYQLAQQQVGLSPDRRQVAIVDADLNRVLQIYVRSFEYNTQRQLSTFNNPNQSEVDSGAAKGIMSYDPAWSPQGDLIAFVSTNTGNDEIYTLRVDGSDQRQLTNNSYEWDKHPSWSPDGTRIVFYSNRDSGKRRLWTMDANGSNQMNLSDTLPPAANSQYEDWDPIWVP